VKGLDEERRQLLRMFGVRSTHLFQALLEVT